MQRPELVLSRCWQILWCVGTAAVLCAALRAGISAGTAGTSHAANSVVQDRELEREHARVCGCGPRCEPARCCCLNRQKPRAIHPAQIPDKQADRCGPAVCRGIPAGPDRCHPDPAPKLNVRILDACWSWSAIEANPLAGWLRSARSALACIHLPDRLDRPPKLAITRVK
jgi:hypothetical protein